MTVIGTDSFLQVEYIPARISVEKHIRQKAVCKKCSKKEKAVFNTAKAPLPLIEGSIMTPSLLSHIICEKYVKSVPLYRIEQECRWSGMNFSRQTFCNNIIAAADIFKPLYELFHKYLVKLKILHADETPHQVNVVRGHEGKVRGYMWVYRSGRYEYTPLVMYEYRNGRKAEYPRDFLAGFTGYLHCDGLKQYDYVRDVIRVGCYAHLRRYFLNAVNVQHNKKDLTTPAGTGLRMINEIFYTENRDPEKPYERSSYTLPEIKRIRAEKSQKLAERFFEWCEKQPAGNDLFGRAIGYALSQKRSLMNVFLDPKLELTNNAAERAVKSVVMGRKNWLFAHCERGAEANAILYTIVETAKANLLKPYEYIKWVLERIRNVDFKSFEELLPWNKNLPEYLRVEGC